MFPQRLRAAGLSVEAHGDHFAPACPDAEWLEAVTRRGWVAVTHDARIRYKPNELAAVKRARARLLVLVGKAAHMALAESFVHTWPQIETFIDLHQPPFIAKVYRPSPTDLAKQLMPPGRIELWYPKPE